MRMPSPRNFFAKIGLANRQVLMKVVIGFSALSLMLTACTQTFTGTEGDATVAPVSGVPMTAADSAYRLMARDPAFAELFKVAHQVVAPLYQYANTLPEPNRSNFLDSTFAVLSDTAYLASIDGDTSAIKSLLGAANYEKIEEDVQAIRAAQLTLAQNIDLHIIKNGSLTSEKTKESLAFVPEVSHLLAEGGSEPNFPGPNPNEENDRCRDACDSQWGECVGWTVFEFAGDTIASLSVPPATIPGMAVTIGRLIRNSRQCDRDLTGCLGKCK